MAGLGMSFTMLVIMPTADSAELD